MKKFARALTLIAIPVIAASVMLAGCKSCKGKPVETPEENEFMRDIDVAPTQKAIYEEQTKQALAEYNAVAGQHLGEDGEPDIENEEVIAAAKSAAAKLYAYACYNERSLDKYVFFSNQRGTTEISGFGSAVADRQEYYLRVTESEETCGYRFHRTIKKVVDAEGTIDTFKSLFETARIRMTDKTNLLYRFEGNSMKVGDEHEGMNCSILTCDWRTGEDWGKPDVQIVKSPYLATLDEIETDIQNNAQDSNRNIRGNINIIAENIVKFASITVDEDDGCINVLMAIDTDVANADEASVKMLTAANGTSGDCNWQNNPETAGEFGIGEDTGLRIIYRLWPNGLFRTYSVIERWRGKMDLKVAKPTGVADSRTMVYYSYSDHDCDMSGYLEMLEAAKAAKG